MWKFNQINEKVGLHAIRFVGKINLTVIAIFLVYIWGYQLDVRFCSLLGCLQIIFL